MPKIDQGSNVRAKLSLCTNFTGGEFYELLLLDADRLKQFEIERCFRGQRDIAIAR